MRARILAVMVAALVLALAAPALAGPREDAQARRKLLAGQTARAAVIQNGETRENMEQVVVNHFGNPDQGQVLIQTWVEPDWATSRRSTSRGPSRRSRSAGPAPASPSGSPSGSSCDNDGGPAPTSSTVNTGDVNGIAFVQTPEAGGLTTRAGRACGSRWPSTRSAGTTTR